MALLRQARFPRRERGECDGKERRWRHNGAWKTITGALFVSREIAGFEEVIILDDLVANCAGGLNPKLHFPAPRIIRHFAAPGGEGGGRGTLAFDYAAKRGNRHSY